MKTFLMEEFLNKINEAKWLFWMNYYLLRKMNYPQILKKENICIER